MFEGLKPDFYSEERLRAFQVVNADKQFALAEANASVSVMLASLWSLTCGLGIAMSIFNGHWLTFVYGVPCTVMFVKQCRSTRRALDTAERWRRLCELDLSKGDTL